MYLYKPQKKVSGLSSFDYAVDFLLYCNIRNMFDMKCNMNLTWWCWNLENLKLYWDSFF
jgi:hypothetical protein